jgi:hypothetical protein
MVGGSHVDTEEAVNLVRILINGIPENREAGIHNEHVERASVTHARNHRVAVAAVSLDRGSAIVLRQRSSR